MPSGIEKMRDRCAKVCDDEADVLAKVQDFHGVSALEAAAQEINAIPIAEVPTWPVARVIEFEAADFGDMSLRLVRVIPGAQISVGDELYATAQAIGSAEDSIPREPSGPAAAALVPEVTEFNGRLRFRDGWWVFDCDQEPGLYVAHHDLNAVLADIVPSWVKLRELDAASEHE